MAALTNAYVLKCLDSDKYYNIGSIEPYLTKNVNNASIFLTEKELTRNLQKDINYLYNLYGKGFYKIIKILIIE